MPDPYNTTKIFSEVTLRGITYELNNQSDGLLSGMILLSLYLILIVIYRNTDYFHNVLLGSNFILVIIALGMWASGLITVSIMIFPLIITMITIFVTIWSKG